MIKDKRVGCKDVWNAYMCKGAQFSKHDIPFCPTTASGIPTDIITWDEAKTIYRKLLSHGGKKFKEDSYVCFYIDDYKFDGQRGIWYNSNHVLEILRHFSGVITPDFSTYQDFPEPIKLYNTYRMRAYGYWLGQNDIAVINNVRWGTSETWWYCFDGIPENSIVAIGTVGGSPKRIEDRSRFESGLSEMVRVLRPQTIIVYGSANYPCFKKIIENGIKVVAFPSKTSIAFTRRSGNE